MLDTSAAPEFAEGTIELASEVWFCTEHSTSVAVGHECPFCVHDELGPAEFDRWAGRR